MANRFDPELRKEQILTAALTVCSKPNGWAKLTRQAVATEAMCADALVSRYFGTMQNFRRAIMRAAIHDECCAVIAQGLGAGDKQAQKAPEHLRIKALAIVAG